MKLSAESVTFQNFLTFGKIPQTLNFETGINIVTGIDEKTERSNGSGKSSLLETIPFALFGRINKGVKKENVCNWKNKKNCEVTFTFMKGSNEYVIRRGIKPDFLEISENGRTIPAPSDVRIFQRTLENEILFFDYYTFQSLCAINLNSYVPILKMDSVKKRQFLERVFGLETFSILNDKANKKLKKTEDLIYKQKLNAETKEKIQHDLLEQNKTLESQLAKMGTSSVELNDIKSLYTELIEKHNDPEKELVKISNEFLKVKEDYTQLTVDYEELKKTELTKLFDILDSKEKAVDIAIREINNTLTIVNNRVIINKEKISNENSRLNLVEGKTECPTCGEPMKGNFGKNIEKKIKSITSLIKKDDVELKDLSGKLLQAKEEKEKLSKKRKILSINGIETEKMKKLYGKIDSLRIKKNTLEENQKEVKDIVGKVISLREKIELLQEQVKKENETRNSFQTIITGNELKINELNEDYRNIHGSIKRLNELTDYMEYIKLICRDENIKQYAISSIIPYLTKQTNHYLSDAGSYFYARFDNWLEESIEGPGIYNCTYGNLSGAESKSIDLAVQFAFLDIARIQAGLFPDILILDELLDSSVDGTGLNNILGIIKRRQKDDDSKVYLITHRSEISDIDADRTYLVEKRDGFSYLKTY